MRLFVLAESPPTTDPVDGNGSTMITAQVLPRLPADIELHLAYFADRRQEPDAAVRDRARRVDVLPVRGTRAALLAQPITRLPRATWQRAGALPQVREWSAQSDVAYYHGLHTFFALRHSPVPVVANEIDPWSDYWRERSRGRRGPSAWYDRIQASRAARLEELAARHAASLVVVNEADADRLRQRTGARAVAIPNGTARHRPEGTGDGAAATTLAFVGTLDYPPNVEAATRLVRDVLPLVQRSVPDATVVLAGRRPAPQVLDLAGPSVDVLGDVPDVGAVFAGARVAVYPGRTGRGTKNTVGEAVGAGCPVVASVESARGHATGEHLRTGSTDEEIARAVVELLVDPDAARRAREACVIAAVAQTNWDDVADRYVAVLRTAADSRG
jgi:glycosyltransferase involved in cell wall biosynthesis